MLLTVSEKASATKLPIAHSWDPHFADKRSSVEYPIISITNECNFSAYGFKRAFTSLSAKRVFFKLRFKVDLIVCVKNNPHIGNDQKKTTNEIYMNTSVYIYRCRRVVSFLVIKVSEIYPFQKSGYAI